MLLSVLALYTTAHAQSHHSGDINHSGNVDILDVQCAILLNLAVLGVDPSPSCVKATPAQADANCDDTFTVADVQIITNSALKIASAIQGVVDADYYEGWSVLHYQCQKGVRRRDTDWECPYAFEHHGKLALASSATCALDQQGRVWCWGSDANGTLGNFDATGSKLSPSLSHRNGAYSSIDANGGLNGNRDVACAVSSVDGNLWCWGHKGGGQTVPGHSSGLTPGPVRVGLVTDQWLQVAVGAKHACAIKDESPPTLWCWGHNDNGQLGNKAVSGSVHLPLMVSNPSAGSPPAEWAAVSAGGDTTCAILDDGSGWCWGYNQVGTAGNGDKHKSQLNEPTPISGAQAWQAISLHHRTACGITTSGALYCWGSGMDKGLLGVGTPPSCSSSETKLCCPSGPACSSVPLPVEASSTFSSVSVGHSHACAVASGPTAALKCWGDNDVGKLGLGSTVGQENSPAEVDASAAWLRVGAGYDHTCAVKLVDEGPGTALHCWGRGGSGQIGDGFSANRPDPTDVSDFVQSCNCGGADCEGYYEWTMSCYAACGECGDGICSPAHEDPVSCDDDCFCGDGFCQPPEDETSCSDDCGTCGDDICQSNEFALSCPADCGFCGDGLCFGAEDSTSCGLDCVCGDNICQPTESPATCPKDCGYCGDGYCESPETASNCPADC